MQLDTDRFLQDLHSLRNIGRYRTGVHRPTFSADDMASRQWLCERLSEVGLEPTIDGIGNVFGRGPAEGPRLLAGSHLETQNHAGFNGISHHWSEDTKEDDLAMGMQVFARGAEAYLAMD